MAVKQVARRRSDSTRSAAAGTLARLHKLAHDLCWTWKPEIARVFEALDPLRWDAVRHNPLEALAELPPYRLAEIEADARFAEALQKAERAQREYHDSATWFGRTHRGKHGLLVAYFCAEYAIHESLQQYSGGLGVLAGDHLKSSSDLGVPLVAVGLLYRSGYYRQSLDATGKTIVSYPRYDFARMPLTDTGKTITLPLGKASLAAHVWELRVGRTRVVLLDADTPKNSPKLRAITERLYGGDSEYRLQQELLLGIGGMLALDALKIAPTVTHLNEGHAAFAALERLRRLRKAGHSVERAIARVRASTVFTTHTPVPAGHDRFDPSLTLRCLAPYADALGMQREEFLALGRENPEDRREPFCMTVLALRLSEHINGVARLHGETSRRMWVNVYGAERPEDVPIRHVTNGIHTETWLAPPMRPLYDRYLKPRWVGAGPESDWWKNAGRIPAEELWKMRQLLRRRMIQFIRTRLIRQAQHRVDNSEHRLDAATALDENALTIGFARRFATYKRAPLIFSDAKRLAAILSNPACPVQLVFAGKAHPRDEGGQAFAQQIFQLSQREPFRGRVVLLEEYDMEVGRMLTSGCDVWLNNPVRPQEASGTSGMKPPLHGGINCSILDGWWPESYDGTNGWAIGDDADGPTDPRKRDKRDAAAIYELLENQITPEFFDRDDDGIPRRWVERMTRSMQTVCGQFNTHRMVAEYVQNLYMPAATDGASSNSEASSARQRGRRLK